MKTISLRVTKEAQQIGINNPVMCIIENLNVISSSTPKEYIEDMLLGIRSHVQDIYKSDCYKGFKQLFSKLGYVNQKTACDRLIEYYTAKGFKYINNIVDAYNSVSVMEGSPVGVHDASLIEKDIVIRRAKGDEEIRPMFKEKRIKVNAGDIIYESDSKTICWMGKNDMDSDEFKITASTNSIAIMAIGNELTTSEFNYEICRKVYNIVLLDCPEATMFQIPTTLMP